VSFVDQVVSKSALQHGQIQIEITETEIIENKTSAIEFCHRLHALGVSITLDDFGTGYSSLSYLSSLPVNALKVDRSFVQNCDQESDLKILKSVIGLARSLGLKLVVEGVEEAWQLETVRALGCLCVQGFYFSRPLTPKVCQGLNEAQSFGDQDMVNLISRA